MANVLCQNNTHEVAEIPEKLSKLFMVFKDKIAKYNPNVAQVLKSAQESAALPLDLRKLRDATNSMVHVFF